VHQLRLNQRLQLTKVQQEPGSRPALVLFANRPGR
jgi:hypothetical protein